MLTIEITGVFPANQGAMLMFEAILEQVRERLPNARIAVPGNWPQSLRDRYGLWVTRERPLKKTLIFNLMPAPMRRRKRFLKFGEIDVLLDASGFGYGDFWGLPKLQLRLEGRLRRWKRAGRTAVLLPQAFGPFEKPGMASAMRNALNDCDLVFARDAQSAIFLRKLGSAADRIALAPDFTNLLAPALAPEYAWARNASLIIPNSRMVGTGSDSADYPAFLCRIAEALRAKGREPVLLLHEHRDDREIAKHLNDRLDRALNILEPESPLATKAIIANAEMVISSRFHGLVSALSSGVPALATGWTHKYQALLSDYHCEDCLVDVADRESWTSVIDKFLVHATDPAFRQLLTRAAEAEKTKSREMWDRVFTLIEKRHLRSEANLSFSVS